MTKKQRQKLKQLDPMHCITINESEKCVRVHTRGDQDYFTFKMYGSKEKAINAAIRYRDSMPDSYINSRWQYDRQPPRGKINHRGVTLYRNYKNNEILGYYVQWREGPKELRHTKTRAFRFDQYQDALTEAIEFRGRMVKEHCILN